MPRHDSVTMHSPLGNFEVVLSVRLDRL